MQSRSPWPPPSLSSPPPSSLIVPFQASERWIQEKNHHQRRLPDSAGSCMSNDLPRPFKNPNYTKNINRRTKNLKAVLAQERERERVERERRRLEKEEGMDVDVEGGEPRESTPEEEIPTYSSIEAPPSVLPQRRYCDITGLEGPYTDPATGLRYHDKSIYELVKGLSVTAAKDYLVARGVNPIVK